MSKLECYNVQIGSESGVQYFSVDIFLRRYPRIGAMLLEQYNKGVLGFDLRGVLSIRLV